MVGRVVAGRGIEFGHNRGSGGVSGQGGFTKPGLGSFGVACDALPVQQRVAVSGLRSPNPGFGGTSVACKSGRCIPRTPEAEFGHEACKVETHREITVRGGEDEAVDLIPSRRVRTGMQQGHGEAETPGRTAGSGSAAEQANGPGRLAPG